MPEPLTPQARELLAAPNFAVVATHNADGSIQQTVVWVAEQEGEVAFSALASRHKVSNLQRDPSISVLIIDRDNGYRFSAVQGQARLEESGAHELIDELSQAYDGRPWPEQEPRQPRVRVLVAPERIIEH